jgi:hypothetical protein
MAQEYVDHNGEVRIRFMWADCPACQSLMQAGGKVMDKRDVIHLLQRLVWFCHHHEGWQDDHMDILHDAEAFLTERGVAWEFNEYTEEGE